MKTSELIDRLRVIHDRRMDIEDEGRKINKAQERRDAHRDEIRTAQAYVNEAAWPTTSEGKYLAIIISRGTRHIIATRGLDGVVSTHTTALD